MTEWLKTFPSSYAGPEEVVRKARTELFTKLEAQNEQPPPLRVDELDTQIGDSLQVDANGVLVLLGGSFPYRLDASHHRRDVFEAHIKLRPEDWYLMGRVDIGDEVRGERVGRAAGEIAYELNQNPALVFAAHAALLNMEIQAAVDQESGVRASS